MEGLSCDADSVPPGPRDVRVGERCTSIFLFPPLFLKGFAILCEFGNTPVSQPPCKGFMVDRNFFLEFMSFLIQLTLKSELTSFCSNCFKAVLEEKLYCECFSFAGQPPADLPYFFLL